MAEQQGRTFRLPWPGRRPASAPVDWRTTIRTRLVVCAVLFGVWTAGIEARLFYLQVVQYNIFLSRAQKQQMRTVTAPAKRGEILDRTGRVLAYSVDADSVFADPTEIEDPDVVASAVCAALDECDAADRQAMAKKLRGSGQFTYLQRKVSPDEEQRIRDLKLKGIGFLKESRRYYPNKELAAHVLGYVGLDNGGLGGLESAYDTQVKGREGKLLVQTDARQQRLYSQIERAATAGATLELTLDQYLQFVAERELRTGVEENRAAGGSAVIMDPNTGEILAMANYPTFNPNTYGRVREEARRNRAVQDLYEPGSTFKIVTASAALEEHVLRPTDLIDCSPGRITFGSRVIRDTHQYGTLTFTDVLVKSSNVGAIKAGMRLGPERLGQLRQPLRLRPGDRAGLQRRERRHRVEPGPPRSERARVGVDGLSGRRHGRADGDGRQLGRQRRHALRAARRAGGDQGRQAGRGRRTRRCAARSPRRPPRS